MRWVAGGIENDQTGCFHYFRRTRLHNLFCKQQRQICWPQLQGSSIHFSS